MRKIHPFNINDLKIAPQVGAPSRCAKATAAPRRGSSFRHAQGESYANRRWERGVLRARTKKVTRRRSTHARGDARLRALTEHALEIITVQDATGRFTYANEAVVRHLGYSPSELLGRNALDFLHPDDVEAMRETLSRHPRLAGRSARAAIASNTASGIGTAAGAGSRASRSTRSPIPRCSASSRTRATSPVARPMNDNLSAELRALSHRRRPVRRRGARIRHECAGRVRTGMGAGHRARLRLQRRGIPPTRLAELPRQRRLGGRKPGAHAALSRGRNRRIHRRRSAGPTVTSAGSR